MVKSPCHYQFRMTQPRFSHGVQLPLHGKSVLPWLTWAWRVTDMFLIKGTIWFWVKTKRSPVVHIKIACKWVGKPHIYIDNIGFDTHTHPFMVLGCSRIMQLPRCSMSGISTYTFGSFMREMLGHIPYMEHMGYRIIAMTLIIWQPWINYDNESIWDLQFVVIGCYRTVDGYPQLLLGSNHLQFQKRKSWGWLICFSKSPRQWG